MASFTDAKGRAWPFKKLTVADLDDLAALGLDVEAVSEDLDRLSRLVASPRKFAAVLWWFAGREGTDPKDFHAGLDGDALARAVVAVGAAVIDFFPLQPGEKAKMIARLEAAGSGDGSAASASSAAASPASTPEPSASAS